MPTTKKHIVQASNNPQNQGNPSAFTTDRLSSFCSYPRAFYSFIVNELFEFFYVLNNLDRYQIVLINDYLNCPLIYSQLSMSQNTEQSWLHEPPLFILFFSLSNLS